MSPHILQVSVTRLTNQALRWKGQKQSEHNLQQSFMMISRISHSWRERWNACYCTITCCYIALHNLVQHPSWTETEFQAEKPTERNTTMVIFHWESCLVKGSVFFRKLDVWVWTELPASVSDSKPTEPKGGTRSSRPAAKMRGEGSLRWND